MSCFKNESMIQMSKQNQKQPLTELFHERNHILSKTLNKINMKDPIFGKIEDKVAFF